MSVLACDRNGCTNIMCDRLSHTYGYICDECYKELEVSNLCVRDFMETRKGDVFRKAWIDYLNNEFPIK